MNIHSDEQTALKRQTPSRGSSRSTGRMVETYKMLRKTGADLSLRMPYKREVETEVRAERSGERCWMAFNIRLRVRNFSVEGRLLSIFEGMIMGFRQRLL